MLPKFFMYLVLAFTYFLHPTFASLDFWWSSQKTTFGYVTRTHEVLSARKRSVMVSTVYTTLALYLYTSPPLLLVSYDMPALDT